MIKKGDTWNESVEYRDPVTLRAVRRVTAADNYNGIWYNNTPTYHTNSAFTADGEFLVFASAREKRSAIYKCHVPTGEITCLIEPLEGLYSVGMGHLAPRSRWMPYKVAGALRAVNLDTLAERTIVDEEQLGMKLGGGPIDPKEEFILCARSSETASVLYRVPLCGGRPEKVFEDTEAKAGHCQYSPTDPDMLLLDRNFPDRTQQSRVWTLRLSTGELTALTPQDPSPYQMHATWMWDGQAVVYHGPAAAGGWYIGVARPDGRTIREYAFPDARYYGHVGAMPGRPAVIVDGNLTEDLLMWVYYDRPSPEVEIIARHGSDYLAMKQQAAHPHPQCDPTGRWISFNASRREWRVRCSSNVYVVEV